ncbi:MAG: TMCO1/EMC3 family protein [Methanosphaera sp.]|jgi:uncharacterized membrane protein (DUF106 family)|nr:TMCO1/EMC3 family protein [Methanosphaera sp.]
MSYLDFILNPLISLDPNPSNPIFTIFIIATIIAFFIVILQKVLIDYDRMSELQAEMKQLQAEMKAAQKSGDPKALSKVQKKQMELMPKNKELMLMQMKPSFITIIPIMVIYYGMIGNHLLSHVVINIASLQYYLLLIPVWNIFWTQSNPLTINFFGWYILASFTMSFIFRRIFNIPITT